MRLAPLFFCFACSQDVVLQFPFQGDDRAMLLLVEQNNTLDLYAVDVTTRAQMPLLAEYTEFEAAPLQLTALFFPESLADLGLTPGRITPVERGGPLPDPGRIEARLVRDAAPEPWQRLDDLPGRFLALKIPRDTPCRRLTVDRRDDFPSQFDSILALTILNGRPAALQLADGAQRRPNQFLGFSENLPVVAPVNLEATLLAAQMAPDQQLWVAGLDQNRQLSVWRGPNNELTRPFSGVDTVPVHWPYHLAVADPGEGPDVVYLLGRSGRIWRADVNGWTIFNQVPLRPDNVNTSLGALLVSGPRDLWVIPPDGRGLYRVNDEGVVRQRTPIDDRLDVDGDRLLALYKNSLGTFAGSNVGYLLRLEQNWVTLSDPLLVNASVESFTTLGDGLLVGGYYGFVRQFYPDHGECVADRSVIGQRTSVRRMLVMEGSVYFSGRDPLAQTEFMGILRIE